MRLYKLHILYFVAAFFIIANILLGTYIVSNFSPTLINLFHLQPEMSVEEKVLFNILSNLDPIGSPSKVFTSVGKLTEIPKYVEIRSCKPSARIVQLSQSYGLLFTNSDSKPHTIILNTENGIKKVVIQNNKSVRLFLDRYKNMNPPYVQAYSCDSVDNLVGIFFVTR